MNKNNFYKIWIMVFVFSYQYMVMAQEFGKLQSYITKIDLLHGIIASLFFSIGVLVMNFNKFWGTQIIRVTSISVILFVFKDPILKFLKG